MTTALPLLLRYAWRPVLIGAVLIGIYAYGFEAGRSALRFDQVKSQNAHLKSQIEAMAKIAEQAAARAKFREIQLNERDQWINQYAEELRKKADRCELSADDLERLQRL